MSADSSFDRKYGAELEVWVIDERGIPSNVSQTIIKDYRAKVRKSIPKDIVPDCGEFTEEFDQASLELSCTPSPRLLDVARSMVRTLLLADEVAEDYQHRVLPLGCRMGGTPLVVDKPRYMMQRQLFGFWFDEMLLPLAGFHSHDDLFTDPLRAANQMRLTNAIRPVIIAFNACTPVFAHRLTKYNSSRTHYYILTYEENGLERNGCLLNLDHVASIKEFQTVSEAAYQDIIARMEFKGITDYQPYFTELNSIWGGVRMSNTGANGTVESRISDSNPQLDLLWAEMALHRGINNLLAPEGENLKVGIHHKATFDIEGDTILIPSHPRLYELEQAALQNYSNKPWYSGIHPHMVELCYSVLHLAERGLHLDEERALLAPYYHILKRERFNLAVIIREHMQRNFKLGRDMMVTEEMLGELRNWLYADIYQPSLQEWAARFSLPTRILQKE